MSLAINTALMLNTLTIPPSFVYNQLLYEYLIPPNIIFPNLALPLSLNPTHHMKPSSRFISFMKSEPTPTAMPEKYIYCMYEFSYSWKKTISLIL